MGKHQRHHQPAQSSQQRHGKPAFPRLAGSRSPRCFAPAHAQHAGLHSLQPRPQDPMSCGCADGIAALRARAKLTSRSWTSFPNTTYFLTSPPTTPTLTSGTSPTPTGARKRPTTSSNFSKNVAANGRSSRTTMHSAATDRWKTARHGSTPFPPPFTPFELPSPQ